MSENSASPFEYLVPPRCPELFNPKEAGKILGGFERDYIYNLVTSGELEGHRRLSEGGGPTHLRVTRRSLVAHLLKTSLYEPGEILTAVESIVRTMTPEQRRQLAAFIAARC